MPDSDREAPLASKSREPVRVPAWAVLSVFACLVLADFYPWLVAHGLETEMLLVCRTGTPFARVQSEAFVRNLRIRSYPASGNLPRRYMVILAERVPLTYQILLVTAEATYKDLATILYKHRQVQGIGMHVDTSGTVVHVY